MKKTIIYISLFLLLLNSCITEVDFDEEFIEPKLVVNAFISPDSLFKINVSSTRSIIGVERNYPIVQNASVDVYENGTFIESLSYTEKPDTIWGQSYKWNDDSSENGGYFSTDFYIERIDTISYYLGSFFPTVGKEYEIEVKKKGFETIRASATIPETVSILSLDTTISIESNEDYTNSRLKIALKFHDPANEENFYRIKVHYKEGYFKYFEDLDGDSLTSDSIPVVSIYEWYQNYSLNSDDIVLVGEEGADDILFGTPSNTYNIFNDKLISGLEHDLTFYNNQGGWYDNEYFKPEFGEFVSMTIYLESISKESFLYMQSYTNFWWIDGDLDMFIEPVQVYNNIENGAGIFGAASSDSYTIRNGEYPMQGVKYIHY